MKRCGNRKDDAPQSVEEPPEQQDSGKTDQEHRRDGQPAAVGGFHAGDPDGRKTGGTKHASLVLRDAFTAVEPTTPGAPSHCFPAGMMKASLVRDVQHDFTPHATAGGRIPGAATLIWVPGVCVRSQSNPDRRSRSSRARTAKRPRWSPCRKRPRCGEKPVPHCSRRDRRAKPGPR